MPTKQQKESRIYQILTFPLRRQIEHAVDHICRNANHAPICCEQPMNYIGEHGGQTMNTQIYQCNKCKCIEILHLHDWDK